MGLRDEHSLAVSVPETMGASLQGHVTQANCSGKVCSSAASKVKVSGGTETSITDRRIFSFDEEVDAATELNLRPEFCELFFFES